jgi:hypothetical protein
MAFNPNPLEWVVLVILLIAPTVVVAINLITSAATHFMVFYRDMLKHPNKPWIYRKVFHPFCMQTALAVSFLLSAGATYVYEDDTLRQSAALGLPAPEGVAPGPSETIFEWTWILYFIGYGLQMVIAFCFYYGHMFRLSSFLAFIVWGILVTLSPLYWVYLLAPGLLQMFAALVYLYVLAWHVYWATLSHDLHVLYQEGLSPMDIMYARMAKAPAPAPQHARPGAHTHHQAAAAQTPSAGPSIPMQQQQQQQGYYAQQYNEPARGAMQRPMPRTAAVAASAYRAN